MIPLVVPESIPITIFTYLISTKLEGKKIIKLNHQLTSTLMQENELKARVLKELEDVLNDKEVNEDSHRKIIQDLNAELHCCKAKVF